jgi:hypothetical protein
MYSALPLSVTIQTLFALGQLVTTVPDDGSTVTPYALHELRVRRVVT